jgi:hypothetical protein
MNAGRAPPKSKAKAPLSRFQFQSTLAAYFTAFVFCGTGLSLFHLSRIDTNATSNLPQAAASASSDKDYSLAREQSFGYFTDITNENWRIAQTYHAKLFPNYYANLENFSNGPNDKGKIDKLRQANSWYGDNFQVEFICPLARRLPSDSMADGPKWVCDPHRLAKKKDCLVYSVGSNGKNEFEKAVKDEVGQHCEIHTFDMVSYNRRNGHFKDALQGYAEFHDWGLGTEGQANRQPNVFKTLNQTMHELGHSGRTIDIFKIDCEWCEWFVWQEWLTVDVRQILVETHNAPMPNARDMFFGLHDAGFVVFSKEANYVNGAGGVEYAFVKLSTDFFVDDSMYYKAMGKGELPGVKNYEPIVPPALS